MGRGTADSIIKEGLRGGKDYPWPLILMLGDGLWTIDSAKSATSSRRAYLAEKTCPWPLLLMLGDGLWTADSNKCTIPPSQPPHQGGPTWQNRLRDYLAE
ncbi:unnamed protein product [Sphagnum jensenii]|jgi:hypothetical protein|uniref:Uncharacterized protein n=1 Tax=Sphagnum jensenii TaxID=128206 RepID=A0ABP1B9W9_9BRYO